MEEVPMHMAAGCKDTYCVHSDTYSSKLSRLCKCYLSLSLPSAINRCKLPSSRQKGIGEAPNSTSSLYFSLRYLIYVDT